MKKSRILLILAGALCAPAIIATVAIAAGYCGEIGYKGIGQFDMGFLIGMPVGSKFQVIVKMHCLEHSVIIDILVSALLNAFTHKVKQQFVNLG